MSALTPQVVDPVPDIDRLLSRMDVVIAPSLWLEAWGMVVTEGEASLGIPEWSFAPRGLLTGNIWGMVKACM